VAVASLVGAAFASADQDLFRESAKPSAKAAAAAAAAVPAGFQDTLVATVPQASSLAFTPDGRMLIGAKYGLIRVYKNGALLPTTALDIRAKTCTEQERGLEGMVADPDFASNHHIYVYYTFNKYNTCAREAPPKGPVNRLSRFTLGDNDIIDPASEVVLLDEIPNPGGYHAAGGVYVGKDNFLYVTVGDGGCDWAGNSGCGGANDAARDRNTLLGKVLRITTAGGIPVDNPFRGTYSARCNKTGRTAPGFDCQETFAYGLRNPFRLGFDPNATGTRFFIGDVGQETWEEIDEGKAGANYGWNVREGPCATSSTTNCGPPPAGLTNPIYHYPHSSGCTAVSGGAFVPNNLWPPEYDGKYLFGDYVCAKILMLTPNALGYTASDFATGVGDVVDMMFGPAGSTQALYYVIWTGDPAGNTVHRIQYTGNRSPVAVARANKKWGAAPLTVAFDGSGSSDPDGEALTYDWNFGDGSAHSTAANPTHAFGSGTYLVTLKVTDTHGASTTDGMRIDAGNNPPLPGIESPTTSTRFRVGQSITLHGFAGDPEDGPLANSALSWTVLLHHNTHTHPFLGPRTGNDVTFTTPPPEDLRAAATSYLEVRLTATDSKGLTTTVTRDLLPSKVELTFGSNPGGVQLMVDGAPVTAPYTATSWVGHQFTVEAQAQASGGKYWAPGSWSDGGAAKHTITAPATPTNYTANFNEAQCGGGFAFGGFLVTLFAAAGRRRARRRREAG
jgi:glucose/arabinose dehydrogenase/PKD repeat protein